MPPGASLSLGGVEGTWGGQQPKTIIMKISPVFCIKGSLHRRCRRWPESEQHFLKHKYIVVYNNFYRLLHITYEPVNPVEKGPQVVTWRTPHECQEGLDETKTHSDKANNSVWVWADGFRKAPQFKQDENKTSHCESPGQNHEVSVPDEPLIKIEAAFWGPCLLEISYQWIIISVCSDEVLHR